MGRLGVRGVMAVAAAVVLCLSGCAGMPSADGPSSGGSAAASGPTPSPEIITRETSSRYASSLQEWTEKNLRFAKQSDKVSDRQIQILEESVRSGEVSTADYERAWSNYKQCVVGKGQPEPQLVKYPNGLYAQMGVTGGERKAGAFLSAAQACNTAEVLYVVMVYNAQVGNPGLYQDSDEQMVDCLHRAEFIPKSYTVDDYRRERRADAFSFDKLDVNVRSCEVASNKAVLYDSDPVQDLGW